MKNYRKQLTPKIEWSLACVLVSTTFFLSVYLLSAHCVPSSYSVSLSLGVCEADCNFRFGQIQICYDSHIFLLDFRQQCVRSMVFHFPLSTSWRPSCSQQKQRFKCYAKVNHVFFFFLLFCFTFFSSICFTWTSVLFSLAFSSVAIAHVSICHGLWAMTLQLMQQ